MAQIFSCPDPHIYLYIYTSPDMHGIPTKRGARVVAAPSPLARRLDLSIRQYFRRFGLWSCRFLYCRSIKSGKLRFSPFSGLFWLSFRHIGLRFFGNWVVVCGIVDSDTIDLSHSIKTGKLRFPPFFHDRFECLFINLGCGSWICDLSRSKWGFFRFSGCVGCWIVGYHLLLLMPFF